MNHMADAITKFRAVVEHSDFKFQQHDVNIKEQLHISLQTRRDIA